MDRQWLYEFVCAEVSCGKPVYLHPSCYRGHKYCSKTCSGEAKKRKHKVTRKNYEAAEEARAQSALREQKLRDSRKPKDASGEPLAQEVSGAHITTSADQHRAGVEQRGQAQGVTYQTTSVAEEVSEIVAVRRGGSRQCCSPS